MDNTENVLEELLKEDNWTPSLSRVSIKAKISHNTAMKHYLKLRAEGDFKLVINYEKRDNNGK